MDKKTFEMGLHVIGTLTIIMVFVFLGGLYYVTSKKSITKIEVVHSDSASLIVDVYLGDSTSRDYCSARVFVDKTKAMPFTAPQTTDVTHAYTRDNRKVFGRVYVYDNLPDSLKLHPLLEDN